MKIEVSRLSKIYGQHRALKEISFIIGIGVTALLGPNGAGKTTLLNILATLLSPTDGHARIGNFDVRRQRREIRRIIGFLPQGFGLYDKLNGFEFLDYMCVLKGVRNRREAVQQALDQVGLSEEASRQIGTYSGGMRQRLGIAQSLLNTPPLLLIDEPTAGLDPHERIRFRQLIAEIAVNRTVLLSTHLIEDVAHSAQSVLIMRKGELRFNDTVQELAASAEGLVWTARVNPTTLAALRQHYTVTQIVPEEGEFRVKFIADTKPVIASEPVKPDLEDAYLRWM